MCLLYIGSFSLTASGQGGVSVLLHLGVVGELHAIAHFPARKYVSCQSDFLPQPCPSVLVCGMLDCVI